TDFGIPCISIFYFYDYNGTWYGCVYRYDWRSGYFTDFHARYARIYRFRVRISSIARCDCCGNYEPDYGKNIRSVWCEMVNVYRIVHLSHYHIYVYESYNRNNFYVYRCCECTSLIIRFNDYYACNDSWIESTPITLNSTWDCDE